MHSMDLNLLIALDVLLGEQSVQLAAERLGLSPSAMSRTLSRIRDATGDPILVRAGRRLVPTARAETLREPVQRLVRDAAALFAPIADDPIAKIERVVTIRAEDALAGFLAGPLSEAIAAAAPRVTLRFVAEGDEEVSDLREGRVDLDIGVQDSLGPEIRTQPLFEDAYVGVVRLGHPLLRARITPTRLVGFPHVGVSRRGRRSGPLDEALDAIGKRRSVSTILPTFNAALLAVASSDLVAAMPSRLAARARSILPVRAFDLGLLLPHARISLAWHPRYHADPIHRWLRSTLREISDAWVDAPDPASR